MQNSQQTIMIVDDEEMVLTSLAGYLGLETEYTVVTYTSARGALQWVADHEVDVIVSDFLMPEMDGLTFLRQARDLKPDVPRIILTGYADKENAIKAINEVGLFHYIEKPWDNDDLRIILRNGVEKRQLLRRLRDKIGEITRAHAELRDIQQEILKAFA